MKRLVLLFVLSMLAMVFAQARVPKVIMVDIVSPCLLPPSLQDFILEMAKINV